LKILVKVRLRFQKSINEILIKYNTFEKVTWDLFLATSISLRAGDQKQAETYIDEITGNGSLNYYFKKMIDNINELSNEDKKSVLESNLFPVLKIDNSNHYEYYPEVDQSIINGKAMKGNIGNDIDFHMALMSDPKGKFHSSSVSFGEIKDIDNVYNILINDKSISCEIVRNNWISISEEIFKKIVSVEVKQLDQYQGHIYENPDGDSWNILTNSLINNLKNSTTFFYRSGDFHMITNEGVKRIQIGKIYGIYIYNEKNYSYSNQNSAICETVLNELINSKNINTFKTKPLVQILCSVTPEHAQEAINYVLHRKNSAEIAQVGLDLLANGFERNWNDAAVENFRKVASSERDIINLYKIAPDLLYLIEELIFLHSVDQAMLSEKHRKEVYNHFEIEKNIKVTCAKILGDIIASGNREQSKRLPNTSQVKKYRNGINQLIAHSQIDVNKLSGTKLMDYQKQVMELWALHIQMIDEIKKLDKNQVS
jgi:hypothetical protein